MRRDISILVSEEDTVLMLYLTINKDVEREELFYQSKGQIEGVGMTIEDAMGLQGRDFNGDQDLSLEEYKTFQKILPDRLDHSSVLTCLSM